MLASTESNFFTWICSNRMIQLFSKLTSLNPFSVSEIVLSGSDINAKEFSQPSGVNDKNTLLPSFLCNYIKTCVFSERKMFQDITMIGFKYN